jgi:hypothetical protein
MENEQKIITLTDAQLARTNASDLDPALVAEGQAMMEDEKQRSTFDTLKTHWRAALYSLALSSALIMEGYDAVIVSAMRNDYP